MLVSYSKIRTVISSSPYGEIISLVTPSFFSKTRKGVCFRPSLLDTTTYIYIQPYDVTTQAVPTAESVLQEAKYVIKGGQEAVDLATGKNIGYAVVTNTSDTVWMLIEEYL